MFARNPSRPGSNSAFYSTSGLLRRILQGRRLLPTETSHRVDSQGHQDGQALIELAIALPVVFAFVFTMMQLCLVFYTYCVISQCAREGTRYAIVRGATCLTSAQVSCTASPTDIQNYVLGLGWPNLGGGSMSVNTSSNWMFPDGDQQPPHRVRVTVTYVFPISLPFVPRNSISMGSTSVMYIVQ